MSTQNCKHCLERKRTFFAKVMINCDFIYYQYVVFVSCLCLPSLLNTVILLFNLVKNEGRIIHRNSKNGFFLLQNGGGG